MSKRDKWALVFCLVFIPIFVFGFWVLVHFEFIPALDGKGKYGTNSAIIAYSWLIISFYLSARIGESISGDHVEDDIYGNLRKYIMFACFTGFFGALLYSKWVSI